MPPIPEDACIISDYMLMADYVKQTDVEYTEISKGVRYVNGSRDHFCDTGGALSATPAVNVASQYGLFGGKTPSSTHTGNFKLPFFGTTGQALIESSGAAHVIKLGGATATKTALDSEATGDNENNQITISGNTNGDVTLGMTNIESLVATGSYRFYGHHVVTPIHTSSHYQSFETPYLHELVGGDRNMEQNNLVVTADGKSWDEVTRDTSYIGPSGGFNLSSELANASGNTATIIFTLYRGGIDGVSAIDEKYASFYNKDFAIAYDRMICLRDGTYMFNFGSHATGHVKFVINGEIVQSVHSTSVGGGTAIVKIKRGDFVYRIGGYTANSDDEWSVWSCNRIGD